MQPMLIKGANRFPGAPVDWNVDRDGPCGALPVRMAAKPGPGQGVLSCESAWQPTSEELALLNYGGVVVLHVAGWQVPVSLRVEPRSEASAWNPSEMEKMDHAGP